MISTLSVQKTSDSGEIEKRSIRKAEKSRNYTMIIQENFRALGADKTYVGSTSRMFNMLLGLMDFNGDVKMTPGKLAENMNISPAQASKSLCDLKKRKMITKYIDHTGMTCWHVSEKYSWRGPKKLAAIGN